MRLQLAHGESPLMYEDEDDDKEKLEQNAARNGRVEISSEPSGFRWIRALLTTLILTCLMTYGMIRPADASTGLKQLIAIKKKKEKDDAVVVVETDKGTFKIKLYEEEAPETSEHFLELVRSGFYDGLVFHRYDPGFCIQGGDPSGTGKGGISEKVPLEVSPKLRHDEIGMVGLAHKVTDPNSGSSQFYIILGPASFLDDDYAIFAKVVDGMESIIKLRKGDKMTKVFVEGEESKDDKKSKK